ncbi:hypothetical protein [Peribacillus alkalitolerans]|uniref:hypothetical protein n=1 Tax=Peribacillus alkalitolerans TaxID=1550385 RepID=UPI0013D389DD|nr:hypothetical protein [Peribacillus alkalitolerans]
MSLAICVLITWVVIIVLHLIPKKLSELDMIFLYFVNTIFELSIFTILHINLHRISVNHDVEKSLADLTIRLIMIPLVFVITANLILYSWKKLKWLIVIAIILSFILMGKLMESLDIIKTHNWHIAYTILLFSSYALFSSVMAWLITRVDQKEVKKA